VIADLGLRPLELDLCCGESITTLASRLRVDHPDGVDLLVNNAGYGLFGAVGDHPDRRGAAPVRGESVRAGAPHPAPAACHAGAGRIHAPLGP
jgi:NAD(P)-dependent dehydrogenase (short-subunit alcohol dehydrogenase family)